MWLSNIFMYINVLNQNMISSLESMKTLKWSHMNIVGSFLLGNAAIRTFLCLALNWTCDSPSFHALFSHPPKEKPGQNMFQKYKYMHCYYLFTSPFQISVGVPCFIAPTVISLSPCLSVSPQKHLNLKPHARYRRDHTYCLMHKTFGML